MSIAESVEEVGSPQRPEAPTGGRRWVIGIFVVLTIGAIWSVRAISPGISDVIEAPGEMWKIFRAMFPPAFQTEIDRGVVGKVFESLYIAWIGTIIAALISFPLSFLAAGNVAPRWIRYPIRQLFNAIRAVPELIVAMVLLAVVGLGPWAGALAIGLHSVGTLGKLSTEAIENADDGPLEAISASGGTWISGMRWGMVPQVLPTVISYWLFRFEINIRASTVLGLIGAGGVGSELSSQLAFRNFPQVGAVLVFTVALVLVIDTISGFVRRQVITGTGRKVDGGHTEVLFEDMLGSKLAPKT
jgi:phosphonate transport system permease protein